MKIISKLIFVSMTSLGLLSSACAEDPIKYGYDRTKYLPLPVGCGRVISITGAPTKTLNGVGSGSDIAMIASAIPGVGTIAAGVGGVLAASGANSAIDSANAVDDGPITIEYLPDYSTKSVTLKFPSYKDLGMFVGQKITSIVLTAPWPKKGFEPLSDEVFLQSILFRNASDVEGAGTSPVDPSRDYLRKCLILAKSGVAVASPDGKTLVMAPEPEPIARARTKYTQNQ